MSVSVTVSDAGGGVITVSYSTTVETNLHRQGGYCNVSPGGSLSGPSGSGSWYVGYNTAVTATAGIDYLNNSDNSFNHSEAASGSGATGNAPPPPAAPGTPTLSGVTNASTRQVDLTWTNVGASGYYVYRDGAFFASVTVTSWSEVPSDGLAHTYVVVAYNSGTGGTTVGAASNSYSATVAGVYVKVGGTIVRKPTLKPISVKVAGTIKVT